MKLSKIFTFDCSRITVCSRGVGIFAEVIGAPAIVGTGGGVAPVIVGCPGVCPAPLGAVVG